MKIIGRDKQWQFLLAGNSTLTIVNDETGNRFTYKVRKKEVENSGAQVNLYFVSLLNGPDNENDFCYLGTIFFNGNGQGDFRTTRNSKVTGDAPSFKAFKWLFSMLQKEAELPDKVKFYHEGRCGRCGRTLTVPESIESGYGPECISML